MGKSKRFDTALGVLHEKLETLHDAGYALQGEFFYQIAVIRSKRFEGEAYEASVVDGKGEVVMRVQCDAASDQKSSVSRFLVAGTNIPLDRNRMVTVKGPRSTLGWNRVMGSGYIVDKAIELRKSLVYIAKGGHMLAIDDVSRTYDASLAKLSKLHAVVNVPSDVIKSIVKTFNEPHVVLYCEKGAAQYASKVNV